MIGHIQPPFIALPSLVQLICSLSFGDGGWAVMIFFVISGLCIHLPYQAGATFNTTDFLISRFCRIGVPLIAALALSSFFQASLDKVLWSLYCEMLYYLFYPLLRTAFKRWGLFKVIAVAFIFSMLTALLPDKHDGNFFYFEGAYGFLATAILGLPIWLLGCLLAETFITKGDTVRLRVVPLRLLVFTLGLLLPVLSFLDEVIPGFPRIFLLNTKYSFVLLSPAIYLWLLAEITNPSPPRIFEKMKRFGSGAYSIYLMHMMSIPIFILLPIEVGVMANWIIIIAIALILSAVFYTLIERPSHLLAKRLLILNLPKRSEVVR
jgi:peptidoglycan/LPS O-acetylase OafA/YrhL